MNIGDELGSWGSWTDEDIIDWAIVNNKVISQRTIVPLKTVREYACDTAELSFYPNGVHEVTRYRRKKLK